VMKGTGSYGLVPTSDVGENHVGSSSGPKDWLDDNRPVAYGVSFGIIT